MSKYLKIALVIIIDQLIKLIVSLNMNVGQSILVINGVFHITYIQNKGAAWGSFEGVPIVTIILPIVLIGAIIFFMEKKKAKISPFFMWALVLIIGGGISNLIDRIVRGAVIDMFDFRIWPVFNVADMAVVIGCFMVIFYVIFVDRGKKNKTND